MFFPFSVNGEIKHSNKWNGSISEKICLKRQISNDWPWNSPMITKKKKKSNLYL